MDIVKDKHDVREALEDFVIDYEYDERNREKARDDMRFFGGDQWDYFDKTERDAEGRPSLTINHLPQFVRQVVGDLRNVKPSIKARPNGNNANKDVATVLTGIIRNIEDRSKHARPYISGTQSAVISGTGAFRIETEYTANNPFYKDIILKPIPNPLAVIWDASARMIDRSDAKRCWVREAMEVNRFKKEYPSATVNNFGSEDTTENQYYWNAVDKVLIAEYFYTEMVKKEFILLEDLTVLRLDRLPFGVKRFSDAVQFLDGSVKYIVNQKSAEVPTIKWKKLTGSETLETGEWPTPQIPIIPIIGEETHFENYTERNGLIRWAKDPQRLYNFWRSTQTEIISKSPKAPYLVGKSQIAGFEDSWYDANRGDKPFLPYDDTKNPSRPTREQPPVASSGLQNEIALAQQDMRQTTGIYDAALGAQSNETSGVAIRQRQIEGDISTNFFGDHLEASMCRAGQILIDLIPIIYDSQRTVRLLNEDDTQEDVQVNTLRVEGGYAKLENDLQTGSYDVSVQIGPAYSTKRQESLEAIQDLLSQSPGLIPMFLDIVAKKSDWPGADEIAERARKLLPNGISKPPEDETPEQQQARQEAAQQAEQQQQIEAAQFEAEMADKQAKTKKTEAETLETMAGLEQIALENAMKKLELSIATGEMRGVVETIVAEAIQANSSPQIPLITT